MADIIRAACRAHTGMTAAFSAYSKQWTPRTSWLRPLNLQVHDFDYVTVRVPAWGTLVWTRFDLHSGHPCRTGWPWTLMSFEPRDFCYWHHIADKRSSYAQGDPLDARYHMNFGTSVRDVFSTALHELLMPHDLATINDNKIAQAFSENMQKVKCVKYCVPF